MSSYRVSSPSASRATGGRGEGWARGGGWVQVRAWSSSPPPVTSHQPGSISLTIHFLDWAGGRGAPGPGRRAGPSRHWAWLATSRGARARAGAGAGLS